MQKLLVILGPTATGKTDIGLTLAKKFNGELVACDSRQVYQGLDIGAGKMPGKDIPVKKENGFWVIDGIKIWLYDTANYRKRYTVFDYVADATAAIAKITARKKLPIIVGGTGLYLKGLLVGFPNLGIPGDPLLREDLEKLSLEQLQRKLQGLSIDKYQSLNESDRSNKRRLLRSIELILMYPYINENKNLKNKKQEFDILKIGLSAPRDELNKRIDLRLISRLNQGMIEEAETLHQQGLSFLRMNELGLEYRYLAKYLQGEISKDQLGLQLKNKIHQYAKRQMTWFKRDDQVIWFDIREADFLRKVENNIVDWYNQSNDPQS